MIVLDSFFDTTPYTVDGSCRIVQREHVQSNCQLNQARFHGICYLGPLQPRQHRFIRSTENEWIEITTLADL